MKDIISKLKKILFMNINIKNTYLLGVVVISLFLIVILFSYSFFTITVEKRGVLNIAAGNLYSFLSSEDLNENYQIVVASGEVKSFNIELQNINSIDAKVNLYYEVVSGDSSLVDIGYVESTKDLPPDNNGYVIEKYGSNNKRTITVGINNTGTSSVTIKFGTNVGLSNAALEMPSNSYALSLVELPGPNENILAVYVYDQTNTATKCITGEESTCVALTHSLDATYEQGTIIQYQVNDSESHYFYVLHDDGDTLTMQQREDTTTSAWYSSKYNSVGPTVAIANLESVTSNWTNVNDQTYTMGTGGFLGSDTNGCDWIDMCAVWYNWEERTGKARMITLHEAADQGCEVETNKTCPIYMSNYLSNSTSYGGTVNGTVSYYLTMTANVMEHGTVWGVYYAGYLYYNVSAASVVGVRAVVVVNK